MGDAMEIEPIQLGPRIIQVLHQVETLERCGVEELLPDYPPPGSKQASCVAMDAMALAADPLLSPDMSLVSLHKIKSNLCLYFQKLVSGSCSGFGEENDRGGKTAQLQIHNQFKHQPSDDGHSTRDGVQDAQRVQAQSVERHRGKTHVSRIQRRARGQVRLFEAFLKMPCNFNCTINF